MPKSLDLSSLTRAERVVLTSAVLLVVNGFVPWWYRVTTQRGTHHYNAALTGFGVIAVAAGALAALSVLARTNIWPQPAPRADGSLYTVLGMVAVVSLVTELGRANSAWIGSYVGLGLAFVITAAGMTRRRQRRAGWQ